MHLDFVGLYQNLKTIASEEKGSVVTLIVMLFVVLLGLTEVAPVLLPAGYEWLQIYLTYGTLALTALAWVRTRRIRIDHSKITIGIAPLNVIDRNLKSPLAGENANAISTQCVANILSALNFYKNHLYIQNWLQYVPLPRRMKVTAENAHTLVQKLKIDILIYGDIHYDDGKVYLAPRFEFYKKPTENAFMRFFDKMNDLTLFELKFQERYDEVSILMHYISYIALLFRGIHFTYEKDFTEADKIFTSALGFIESEPPSRTLEDIKLAIVFAKGKNFHLWGNHLLHKGKQEQALTQYEAAEKIFFGRAKEILKQMKKRKDFDTVDVLDCSYLYGVHMLVKEGKLTQARMKLLEIETKYKEKEAKQKVELADAEIVAMEDIDAAKKVFAKLAKENEYCAVEGSRKLGHIAYEQDEWELAVQKLRDKLSKNPFRMYEPEMYDVRSRTELAHSLMHRGRIISGEIEALRAMIENKKNRHKATITFE